MIRIEACYWIRFRFQFLLWFVLSALCLLFRLLFMQIEITKNIPDKSLGRHDKELIQFGRKTNRLHFVRRFCQIRISQQKSAQEKVSVDQYCSIAQYLEDKIITNSEHPQHVIYKVNFFGCRMCACVYIYELAIKKILFTCPCYLLSKIECGPWISRPY